MTARPVVQDPPLAVAAEQGEQHERAAGRLPPAARLAADEAGQPDHARRDGRGGSSTARAVPRPAPPGRRPAPPRRPPPRASRTGDGRGRPTSPTPSGPRSAGRSGRRTAADEHDHRPLHQQQPGVEPVGAGRRSAVRVAGTWPRPVPAVGSAMVVGRASRSTSRARSTSGPAAGGRPGREAPPLLRPEPGGRLQPGGPANRFPTLGGRPAGWYGPARHGPGCNHLRRRRHAGRHQRPARPKRSCRAFAARGYTRVTGPHRGRDRQGRRQPSSPASWAGAADEKDGDGSAAISRSGSPTLAAGRKGSSRSRWPESCWRPSAAGALAVVIATSSGRRSVETNRAVLRVGVHARTPTRW